jgi:hypothetical protein
MIRHHVFAADSRVGSNGFQIKGNGLKEMGAIIRLGKKVLIDVDKYHEWIMSHVDTEQSLELNKYPDE